MPRIAVLVNGRPDSAAGARARGLFEPLQGRHQVFYAYRRSGKIASLGRFLRELNARKPDLVYVVNAAVSGAGAALIARLARGFGFVVDTGDLGYELAELTGRPGWPGRKVIGLTEKAALHFADSIVVRGTYHRDFLKEAGFTNVHVIRDGIDSSHSRSVDAAELRHALGLDGCFCVGLMGTITWSPRLRMCYGWDLVEALALADSTLPIQALVVGDGDGLPYLKQRAQELGVEKRIRFVGRVPYSQVPRYLSAMDIAVSTQTNNRVGNVRTTGKLPEYMAVGCYVLATDVGEARLLLPPEMRLVYDGVRDDRYPRRLADRIEELARGGEERLREATRATVARAREELDYSRLSIQLENVLESVLAPRAGEALR
jgi:glycosyltransferase involved in cell wall biosynthesis